MFTEDFGGEDESDSETSNSDKMFSVSGEGRDFAEIDFSSGKNIDQVSKFDKFFLSQGPAL